MIFMPCEFVFYKFIGSRVRISVLHIIFCLMSLFSISLLSSQSIANQNSMVMLRISRKCVQVTAAILALADLASRISILIG